MFDKDRERLERYPKPVIALTGGIASGKSTVTHMFEDLGVAVIDADDLAREVVAPGTQGLQEIKATFGDGVLLPDGSLDRKKLGARIFENAQERTALNAIVHPKIGELSRDRIADAMLGETPYVMYSAALIVESNIKSRFDWLIVVTSSTARQMERLCRRDGIDQATAQAKIAAQLPLAEKMKVADFLIDNDGSLQETKAQVARVHAAILNLPSDSTV